MEGIVPYDVEEELRCECGLLLMKLTPEGVEVKCRRCKRIRMLPWPHPSGKTLGRSQDLPVLPERSDKGTLA